MQLAALLIPTVSQCCRAGWPLVVFAFVAWFWRNGETLVARFFPDWEWQQRLGWLDIKADRKAAKILAGLTHLLHLALLVALCGILFLSWTFSQPQNTDDKLIAFTLLVEWFYMFACYGVWIYYLGFMLYPRVRDEFEAQELVRYRLEHPDLKQEEIEAHRLKVSLWDSRRPRRF